ncbi:hypothetical protein GCM10010984_07700 [Chishuiella changwenlii]|uniref:DUF2141 domain-containing protein n=2 Tax=Chishuiella changwenlii TaxID=1434701 RepID=A0ABQ1TEV9_9FLAO|nr:DUF2141 domain-containing protein [Chishuiella changwenlii]GGE92528.1 hypothetical protein GCM10010984_07700 [Chishuiella changwenlii]
MMKKFLILLVLFFAQIGFAQIDVKLSINNLKKMKGNLSIEFYRNMENYTKGQNAFKKLYIPVEDLDKYETVFKNVEPTFYAVKVFLDTNNNKKLDKSFLGIRKEPYGFSKNLNPTLREPTFEEAKVEMTEGNSIISISLNNNKGED